MNFNFRQTPSYWQPSQLFGALNRLVSARELLTLADIAAITRIPQDTIDMLAQRGELPMVQGIFPGLVTREAGFIFAWNAFSNRIKEFPNETK